MAKYSCAKTIWLTCLQFSPFDIITMHIFKIVLQLKLHEYLAPSQLVAVIKFALST